ncbi:MAG: rhodanese-like domain-containing protein [Bacteroidetes bacterium]|nr:rhodanese-like domain-containing protein [Bacteroidota bacterium]
MSHYAKLLKQYTWTLVLVLPLLLFTNACSEDDDPVVPTADESALLIAELEGANGDYLNTDCAAILPAATVFEDVNGAKKYYLLDIRSAADFALGHIDGAVNVQAADALTHMKTVNVANYDRIVVVCYTGQTANWVTSLLRLSGYKTTFSMGYGMSAWHQDFDKITAKLSSDKVSQFVTTPTDKGPAGNMPALNTGMATGSEILNARIAAVHAEGFSKSIIDASTVFSNLSQYYIVNFWPADLYTSIGHIPGAMQYTPKADLKLSAALKTLPTDKTIVVYCYTGQGSAAVAPILRTLGYDAKSLMYGANGMIWQKMKDAGKTHFEAGKDCKNFPYVK